MYSLGRSTSVDLDFDYEIYLEDVTEFIRDCPKEFLLNILEALEKRGETPDLNKFSSLEEELKYQTYLSLTPYMSRDELERRLSQ